MKKCKNCGAEHSEDAKYCLTCGVRIEPELESKNVWWIVIAVTLYCLCMIIGLSIGLSSDGEQGEQGSTSVEETQTESSSKYLKRSVSKLINDLEDNALKAKETYDGEYVEITGRVGVIDASGAYISLYPEDNEWAFTGVQCYIKNKKQRDYVKNISKGDVITLRGKITDVGEILGYSLNIDEFVD